MKRIILAIAAAAFALGTFASAPSDKLAAMADKLQSQCPIDINRGWVIQSVTTDDQSVTLTMIVDITADQFDKMRQNATSLKQRFLEKFSANKVRPDGLIAETASSQLPLEVDIVCPESTESINLSFSPDELTGALSSPDGAEQ